MMHDTVQNRHILTLWLLILALIAGTIGCPNETLKPLMRYTVVYDANKGKFPPTDPNAYASATKAVVLAPVDMVNVGRTFREWRTSPNASEGRAYQPGDTIVVHGSVMLYAQWRDLYTVTYTTNGGSGTVPVDTTGYYYGNKVLVKAPLDDFGKQGSLFQGWSVRSGNNKKVYRPGDLIEITSDMKLEALWESVLGVTYHGKGADGDVPVDGNGYVAGDLVTVLPPSTGLGKEGYLFDGWTAYFSTTEQIKYQPGAIFTIRKDIVLYANWMESFIVTYNANTGGIGDVPVDTNRYKVGDKVTVLSDGGQLMNGSKLFDGWGTTAVNSDRVYQPGELFTLTKRQMLWAQWSNNFTVTYYANGAAGTPPVDSKAYSRNADITIKASDDTDGTPLSYVRDGVAYIFDGWNTESNGSGARYTAGTTTKAVSSLTLYAMWVKNPREFWAQRGDGSWYKVTAQKMASGGRSIIYAELTSGNVPCVTSAQAEAIRTEYETYMYAQLRDAFGTVADIDSDGRVTFLLLDIDNGRTGTGTRYAAGYFDPYHMRSKTTNPYSNETDMLFLDATPGMSNLPNFYTAMAHEMQHLILYSQTVAQGRAEKELWLNEGLSTAAEYVYYAAKNGGAHDTGTGSRLKYFKDDPGATICYGNNFYVWDGHWEADGDVLANYATAYLFFQWLRIQSSNGSSIYKDIVNAIKTDYRALLDVANQRIPVPSSYGTSTWTWALLFRAWHIANMCNNAVGIYGYHGEIAENILMKIPSENLTPIHALTGPRENIAWIKFAPGEAIISMISNSSSLFDFIPAANSGANIRYASFAGGASTVDLVEPFYGTILLTANVNSNRTAASETGYLAKTPETLP